MRVGVLRESARAPIGGAAWKHILEVLALVLWYASIAKAADLGVLAKTLVKRGSPTAVQPCDEQKSMNDVTNVQFVLS